MGGGVKGTAIRVWIHVSEQGEIQSPSTGSLLERVAWFALLAVPVLVPTAISKVPFAGQPPLTYNMVVYPKLFALCWCVGISGAAWAAGVASGAIGMRTVPLRWWLLTLVGLGTVSTVVGLSPQRAFFGGEAWGDGLLVFLLGCAIFVLVTQLATTRRRLRAFTWATVIGGVLVGSVGLLQILGLNPLGPYTGPAYITARGASLLGNPDFTGTYLVVPTLLAAALTLSARSWQGRFAAVSAFVLTSTALVVTLTRGAWIGLAIGLIALAAGWWISAGDKAGALWVALAGVAALALQALLIMRDPIRAARQIADLGTNVSGGSGRLIMWREAIAVAVRHPWLGTGPDSYLLGLYGVRPPAWSGLAAPIYNDPHNILLLLAATLGVPAALVAMGFMGSSLYSSAPAAFDHRPGGGRLIYTGWWAAALALGVSLLVTTNTTPAIVVAMSAVGVLAAPRTRPVKSQTWARWALAGGVAILAVAAITVATLTITADATLMRVRLSPDKVALSEQAAAVAPWYIAARQQAAWGRADVLQQQIASGRQVSVADATQAEQRLQDLISADPHEYQNYTRLASFLENAAAVLGRDAYSRAAVVADTAQDVYPGGTEAARLGAAARKALDAPN